MHDASHGTLLSRPRPDTARCHEAAAQRVIATMHERLQEEFPLEAMAEVAIMSPFHFNRTFRHVTGLPPGHFLSALRLEAARRLLLTTGESVTDVCFDVGYNSLGTFTRTFTQVFGVSPRRLRSFADSPPARWNAWEGAGDSRPAPGASLQGVVSAPPDFSGLVFIGAFHSSLPQGAPIACRLLHGPGPFTLRVPAGRFHVYAVGVRQPIQPLHLLILDNALRGSAKGMEINGGPPGLPVNIELRPRAGIDSPILVTLPLLLARRRHLSATLRSSRPPEAVA